MAAQTLTLQDSVESQITPDDTIVFVVYKQGLYGLGVHGLSVDFNHALYMAHLFSKRDKGAFRSYDIYPVPLSKIPSSLSRMSDFGWMNAEPLASVSQSSAHPQSVVSVHNKPGITLFVVYKQGYYGQGVHGISTELKDAKGLAYLAANGDQDDYHSYDIYPVVINQSPPQPRVPEFDLGWMNNGKLYSVVKDRA